jgi:hypothetical protein
MRGENVGLEDLMPRVLGSVDYANPEVKDANLQIEDLRRGGMNYSPSSLWEALSSWIDRRARINQLEDLIYRSRIPASPERLPPGNFVRG